MTSRNTTQMQPDLSKHQADGAKASPAILAMDSPSRPSPFRPPTAPAWTLPPQSEMPELPPADSSDIATADEVEQPEEPATMTTTADAVPEMTQEEDLTHQQQGQQHPSVAGVSLQAIPRTMQVQMALEQHHQQQTAIAATGMLPPAGQQQLTQVQPGQKVMAERYKTRLCQKYMEFGTCPYEGRCMFAHGEHELRTIEMNFRDGLINEDAIRHFTRMQQYKYQAEQAALEAEMGAPPTYSDDMMCDPNVGPYSSAPGSVKFCAYPSATGRSAHHSRTASSDGQDGSEHPHISEYDYYGGGGPACVDFDDAPVCSVDLFGHPIYQHQNPVHVHSP